jgi:hypothetical protein
MEDHNSSRDGTRERGGGSAIHSPFKRLDIPPMRTFLTIAVAAGTTLALMACSKPASEARSAAETTTSPVTPPSDSPPPPNDATTVPPVANPPPTDPTKVPPDVIAPPPGEGTPPNNTPPKGR